MNTFYILAGILTILLGFLHSVFGEALIFKSMRKSGIVPTAGKPVLREKHVRILWATWHMVTVFGWGFAAILLFLGYSDSKYALRSFVIDTSIYCMCLGAALVLIATKGQHPGWVVLFVIALVLLMS